MKLFLASFLQKENFGPGTVISIARGSKPRDIKVTQQFQHFIPDESLIDQYYSLRPVNEKAASYNFVTGFQAQLEKTLEDILLEAKKENVSVMDLLPFKDGDTLCSWERSQYSNYRKVLAPYLEKLGYEVVLN